MIISPNVGTFPTNYAADPLFPRKGIFAYQDAVVINAAGVTLVFDEHMIRTLNTLAGANNNPTSPVQLRTTP